MAIITDPEAVGFVNDSLRPAADRMAQAYYFLKTVLNEWNFNNLGAKLVAGSTDLIEQSDTDTRHQPTADNCVGMVEQIQSYVQGLEATNGANLAAITLLAVNPNP